MQFIKMHGAGNDYVYVDCFSQSPPRDPASLARAMSDRHRGIGSDGLILILPSERADARMRMYNADGSEGEMCGNGIRCLAKYLYDSDIIRSTELRIETAGGVRSIRLATAEGRIQAAEVDMGKPVLTAADIPTTLVGDPPVDVTLHLDEFHFSGRVQPDAAVRVTCVSMGNPHCVMLGDDLSDERVLTLGPAIERHPAFPNRVNVEFAHIVSPREMRVRVWERGAGETLACGTGASAAVVAAALNGLTDRRVAVTLPGGRLDVEWTTSGEVLLTGPAEEVFRGEWRHAA